MAVLTGFFQTSSPIQDQSHVNIVVLDNFYDFLFEDIGCSDVPVGTGATFTTTFPIENITRNVSGNHIHTYFDDFYNRVHVIPNEVDVGNMLSTQTREVEVWNAWTTTKTLNTITGNNVDGISLTGPENPPTTFGPLEQRTYTLVLVPDGPVIIDGTYAFNFTGESPLLHILGRRVLVWPFMPQIVHDETLEFLTNVIETKNTEQRIALRQAPRQSLSYQYLLKPQEYRVAKGLSDSWTYQDYGVPVWGELNRVGPLAVDSMVIPVSTASCDYRNGGLVLIWDDFDHYEAMEITSFTATQLNLKSPLIKSYSNAYVCPVRIGKAMQGVNFTRGPEDTTKSRVEFLVSDNVNLTPGAAQFDQYRGKDVYTDPNFLLSDLSEKVSRGVDVFDNGSGIIETIPQRNFNQDIKSLTIDKLTRADKWSLRQWLHARKGKQKSFWLPTWNPDVVMLGNYGAGSSLLNIQPFGYPEFYPDPKDIMVVFNNGTRYYNRVNSSYTESGGSEVLQLAAAFPAGFLASSVQMICFLTHCRSDTDKFSLKHSYSGRVTVNIPIRGIPE